MAIEEPEYEVSAERGGYEIRHYDPYIVAEVVVDGSYKDAGNRAFRILADYIFGENTAAIKMEMTAPVESRPATDGTRMEMTAPVLSMPEKGVDGKYRYAFVIERKYSLESVPKPIDDRISLRKTDERVVAALRYSGSWSEANYETHRDELMDALRRDGITAIGEPYSARYNAPFVPWFMRRNEVIVDINAP